MASEKRIILCLLFRWHMTNGQTQLPGNTSLCNEVPFKLGANSISDFFPLFYFWTSIVIWSPLYLEPKECLFPCLVVKAGTLTPTDLNYHSPPRHFPKQHTQALRSPEHLTLIHSSQALSPETGPGQNQICTPLLCNKTLCKFKAHSCSGFYKNGFYLEHIHLRMRSRILRRHWYKFRFHKFEVFRRIHFHRHIFARLCRVDSHEDSRT